MTIRNVGYGTLTITSIEGIEGTDFSTTLDPASVSLKRKNRETANIKLNYPNNQTYSFPLQEGDGNYEISCDKPEIIETKMISSCDISIKALALGEAIITVKDQSGNTLDIHVIVDYYTCLLYTSRCV